MQVHGIVVLLPFVALLYLIVRRGGGGAKSSGRVDTAIPLAMALIGCALLALRAFN
jgi:hypothetical protein